MSCRSRHFPRLPMAMALACLTIAPLCGAAAQTEEPYILSGKIDSPSIRISAVPAAPKVTLDQRGEADEFDFTWDGPAGQILHQSFYSLEFSGKHLFQASGGEGTFSPFAAAGTWTLVGLELCSPKNCGYYSGASLAALFPSLTVQVTNPKADITPPVVNAASLLTPSVPASNGAKVKITLNLQDDRSGVFYASVTFGTGGKDGSVTAGEALTYPIIAASTYNFVTYCLCAKVPPGQYTASAINVTDAAGNTTSITDPATIASLFGGADTLTITN